MVAGSESLGCCFQVESLGVAYRLARLCCVHSLKRHHLFHPKLGYFSLVLGKAELEEVEMVS